MGHTAVYDEKSQQIYIFGGCKNKKWFSDIHTLNANTFEWKSVEVSNETCDANTTEGEMVYLAPPVDRISVVG